MSGKRDELRKLGLDSQIAVLRRFLEILKSGEMTLWSDNKNVTQREIASLEQATASLEAAILTQKPAA